MVGKEEKKEKKLQFLGKLKKKPMREKILECGSSLSCREKMKKRKK